MAAETKPETGMTVAPRMDMFRRIIPEFEEQWEVVQGNSWTANCMLIKTLAKMEAWLADGRELKVQEARLLIDGATALQGLVARWDEAAKAKGMDRKEKVIDSHEVASQTLSDFIKRVKDRGKEEKKEAAE